MWVRFVSQRFVASLVKAGGRGAWFLGVPVTMCDAGSPHDLPFPDHQPPFNHDLLCRKKAKSRT